MVRMKSMFAIGFCFTALMGMFNSIFDGRVVAKLPFTPRPTSRDRLTEICSGMTPQTVPSSSCIFSVPCQFDRTSRRFLALPLLELPQSRQVDFLALHLLLGSSLEIKKNPIFLSFFSDIQIRLSNYFTARAIGSLSTWANF